MYFTDVLCIWAYIAQQRMDRLKQDFAGRLQVSEHFLPVFGAVNKKMQDNWKNKGGIKAYSQHVTEVAKDFKDITVADNIWLTNTPSSSISCHLFIKAAELSLINNENDSTPVNNKLSQLIWQLRVEFFQNVVDVSNLKEQFSIANSLGFSIIEIQGFIESGEAMAALDIDRQIKEHHNLKGSPSIILNEGRQILYGNVSCDVISANVQALLNEA